MALTLERVLPFSKSLLEKIVSAGETVIDATAGNGYDTLFLAKLVGESGKVFSFDVQQEAIDSTKAKLEEAKLENVSLILDGHQPCFKLCHGRNQCSHLQLRVFTW